MVRLDRKILHEVKKMEVSHQMMKRKYEGNAKNGFKKLKPVRVFSIATTVLVFFAVSSADTKAEPESTAVYDKSIVAISTTTCQSTTVVKTEKTSTKSTTLTTSSTTTETTESTITTETAESTEITESAESVASNTTTNASTEISTSTTIITTTEHQTIQDESLEVECDVDFNDTLSIYPTEENTEESESTISGVGQYGYNIDPSEYEVLAQVMAHEGEYCDVAVREHIGICMLNRFYKPEFGSPSTLLEIKNAPYQYFYGYWAYCDETAELAKNMIDAYNSGSEYWESYCAERNLTSSTVYQRNDYVVPGTNYVYDEAICTTGGYRAHLYYSS